MDADDYRDEHRTFLQAFFKEPCRLDQESKALFQRIKAANTTDTLRMEYAAFIGVINRAIFDIGLELRQTLRENVRFIVLCNTKTDDFSLGATGHTPSELELMNAIIRLMFRVPSSGTAAAAAASQQNEATQSSDTNGDRYAFLYDNDIMDDLRDTPDRHASLDAIRRCGPHLKPPLTQSRCEELLAQWTTGKWLTLSRNNNYTLGPRGVLELKDWLKDIYDIDDL